MNANSVRNNNESKKVFQSTLRSFTQIILQARSKNHTAISTIPALDLRHEGDDSLKVWIDNIYLPLNVNIYHFKENTLQLLENWVIKMKANTRLKKTTSDVHSLSKQIKVCLRGVCTFLRIMPTHKVAKQLLKTEEPALVYKFSDTCNVSEFLNNQAKITKLGTIPFEEGSLQMSVLYCSTTSHLLNSKNITVNVKDNYLLSYPKLLHSSCPESSPLSENPVEKLSRPRSQPTSTGNPQASRVPVNSDNTIAKTLPQGIRHVDAPKTVMDKKIRTMNPREMAHLNRRQHSFSMDDLRKRYIPRHSNSALTLGSCPIPKSLSTSSRFNSNISEDCFNMGTPPASSYQGINVSSSPYTSVRMSTLKLSVSPFRDANASPFLDNQDRHPEDSLSNSLSSSPYKVQPIILSKNSSDRFAKNFDLVNNIDNNLPCIKELDFNCDPPESPSISSDQLKLEQFLKLMNIGVSSEMKSASTAEPYIVLLDTIVN